MLDVDQSMHANDQEVKSDISVVLQSCVQHKDRSTMTVVVCVGLTPTQTTVELVDDMFLILRTKSKLCLFKLAVSMNIFGSIGFVSQRLY